MLAQIEKADGVEAAWIDGRGRRIAVRARKGTDVAALLRSVGLDVERDPAAGKVPGEGWYRSEDTWRFSEREARELAERAATRARSEAGLTDEQVSRLRALIEKRLLEQFRENHERGARSGPVKISVDGILRDAAEFLKPEQVEAIRRIVKY